MRNLLRENLSLKLASLALAVLVWFYVRGEEKPVQIFAVPLEMEGLAPDLAVAGEVVETLSVRVQSPEVVLRALTPEKLLARVDLSNLGAGDQLVRIRPDWIRVPAGVEVLRVSPEYIPLKIEKKVRRDLPVRPRVAGEPASGNVLAGVTASPPQVAVAGPESAVRQAREVLTEVVRIDGRSSPLEVVVDLYPDRAGVEIEGVRSAQVRLDIHQRYVTRVMSEVRVLAAGAEGAPVHVRLKPSIVTVTVEGPPEAVRDLDTGLVTAVVDVGLLAPRAGEYRIRPRIVIRPDSLAAQLTVRSVSAEEIAVHVVAGRRP